MAKKDFKAVMGNPAERFFTAPAQPSPVEVEKPAESVAAKKKGTHNTQPTHKTKDSTERKTQRAQFLLYPELFADVKKIAHMEQKSVNAIVNGLLEEYRKQNADAIEQYNEIFGKKGK